MPKFRKKPVVIEAFQLQDPDAHTDAADELHEWADAHGFRPRLHAMTALRVELVLCELFDPIEVLNLMNAGPSIPSAPAPA